MGQTCCKTNHSQEENKGELIPEDSIKQSQTNVLKPEKLDKCPVSEEVKELTKQRKKVSYKDSKKSDNIFMLNNDEEDDVLANNDEEQDASAKSKIKKNPNTKGTDVNLTGIQKVFSEAFIPAQNLNIARTFMPLPNEEEKLVEGAPTMTLFERFGGNDGMTMFTNKLMDKVIDEPTLFVFFKNSNVPLITEKLKQYLSYLAGGQQLWIGKSMHETHKNLGITDDLFDTFVQLTVQTLKELKIKDKNLLRDTVQIINSIREQIVIKPEVVAKVSNTTFDKIGGMEKLTQISDLICDKIYEDSDVAHFFLNTKKDLHKKRFAYFLAAACDGPNEWVGKSMKEAHRGKGIKEEHFLKVGMHIMKALEQFQVDKEIQTKIFEKVYNLKKDIVQPKTLYNRIIDMVPLDIIIEKFIKNVQAHQRMSKLFSFVNAKNLLMYFAQRLTSNYGNQPSTLRFVAEMHITQDDFEFITSMFKQVLLELQLDLKTVEETVHIFEELKEITSIPEPPLPSLPKIEVSNFKEESQVIQIEEVPLSHESFTLQHNQQQLGRDNRFDGQQQSQEQTQKQKTMEQNVMTFVEKPLQKNSNKYAEHTNKDLSQPVSVQKDLGVVNPVTSQQDQQQVEEEKQQSEPGHHIQEDQNLPPEEEPEQAQPQVENNPPSKRSNNHSNKHSNKSLDIVIDQNIQMPESPISNHRNDSPPQKIKPAQKTYKYVLSELLCDIRNDTLKKDLPAKGSIICQGELQRFMDKQKTQLPRWLILNAKALLIYKDQMHSKSFPYKPLYAIPLLELKSVEMKEVNVLATQRKQQIVYMIEIELQDQYRNIADQIAQLVSSLLTHKEEPHVSPQKGITKQVGKASTLQKHGYEDKILSFSSSNKKDILKWHRVLNEHCKPTTLAENSHEEQIRIIDEINQANLDKQQLQFERLESSITPPPKIYVKELSHSERDYAEDEQNGGQPGVVIEDTPENMRNQL